MSGRERITEVLAAHFPHGYRCGESCDHNLNSSEGWAAHVADAPTDVLADVWDEGHQFHAPVSEFGETPCLCVNPYRPTP